MNCHRLVTASTIASVQAEKNWPKRNSGRRGGLSPQLQKFYDALELTLDEKQGLVPVPEQQPRPVPWIKSIISPTSCISTTAAHVRVGVTCQECHGPVETMEQIRQVSDLSWAGAWLSPHLQPTGRRARGSMHRPIASLATTNGNPCPATIRNTTGADASSWKPQASACSLAATAGCRRARCTMPSAISNNLKGVFRDGQAGPARRSWSMPGRLRLAGEEPRRAADQAGQPTAPVVWGGLCAAGQAAVLGLYDSQRLAGPLAAGKPVAWERVDG